MKGFMRGFKDVFAMSFSFYELGSLLGILFLSALPIGCLIIILSICGG
jgi:hypothetical protein